MKTCHFSVEVLSGFVGKLIEDDLDTSTTKLCPSHNLITEA